MWLRCLRYNGDMKNLVTRWQPAADQPLPEYPRPQLVRERYVSLNGRWQYRILQAGQETSAGEILVPYAPEAPLSGVSHILQPDETLIYEAKFDLPEGYDRSSTDRVLLHFGAVDQVCTLWVNEREIGSHEGGYTAFTFDITEALRAEDNTLRLQVQDRTEQAPYGRGKQRVDHNCQYASLFYTPVSGIWKSVWMECVPQTYIARLRITPLYDAAAVRIEMTMGGSRTASDGIDDVAGGSRTMAADSAAGKAGEIDVLLRGSVVAHVDLVEDQTAITIPLPGFEAWSPEHPALYDVSIRVSDDAVRSYFAMRKVETRRDARGILRFYLNDAPIFLNGVLDQGYWPDGLLTPPADEAYVYDIETLRDMGYNLIRKHVKVEAERFYYHCDRLGMLVWQDMPNGGGEYNMGFVTTLPNVVPWLGRHIGDQHYKWFARADAAGREIYYQELEEAIGELYNHPSIIAWVPFNEGWGQFDAQAVTARIRELDATRLVNQACGWYDQGGGDVYAIHNYFWPLRTRPQRDRVVALTEYGGYALPVPGHMACDKEFGYKDCKSPAELTDAYEALLRKSVLGNLTHGLSAAIYTQVSDIEEEINGLMTYDREVTKMDPARLRAIHAEIDERFEALISAIH